MMEVLRCGLNPNRTKNEIYPDRRHFVASGHCKRRPMPKVKQYTTFKRRMYFAVLPWIIAAIVCFVLMVIPPPPPTLRFFIGVGGFILSIVIGLVTSQIVLRNFHCPDCGDHIPEPTNTKRLSGDPINYLCKRCDVLWETGLTESEDYGD